MRVRGRTALQVVSDVLYVFEVSTALSVIGVKSYQSSAQI